jgi:class 3 adenylate cyclase
MEEGATTPQSAGGEQRTLASIMFTDVVSFSKHTAINEERTYRALNRDFDLIYREVAAHNGQVLNTMGDGMMVIFMSAVQCVQCAIAIQGELYRQALAKPEDGVLQHRLGLHVGDIFLNGKNTMGDGVNQAARIQALARPESIAMSREFHKMVDGKTPFKAKYMGLQRAKNIPEAIPIWEISPIDDEIRQRAAEALFTPQSADSPQGATGRRGALILVVVLVLLALASAPIFLLKSASGKPASTAKGEFPTGKAGKSVAQKLKDRLNHTEISKSTPSNNMPTETISEAKPTTLSLNASEVADVSAKTNSHDYSRVAEILRKAKGADTDDGRAMLKKYDDLTAFQKWLNGEVASATESAPISASIDGVPVRIYSVQAGTVIDNGTPTTRNLWDYKESTIVVIAETVVAKPPSGTPAPTDAVTWIATFEDVHKI